MNISFEIVPRNEESLKEQLGFIEQHLSFVDTINIPDLLRMPIRSWQAGEYINRDKYHFIPHFRAIDFNLKENTIQQIIEDNELDRVLLVSGDPPPNMSHRVYDTSVLDMIARIRKDFPSMKIFAGFDPYRSSVKDERNYMLKKFDAGADCLLSQPFFDMRLLQIYSELVPQENIYWGISPVTTEKSKTYWENINNAVFPQSYEPTYEWNVQFALDVLKHCATHNSHVYFMPINVNLEKYFLPIAEQAGQYVG